MGNPAGTGCASASRVTVLRTLPSTPAKAIHEGLVHSIRSDMVLLLAPEQVEGGAEGVGRRTTSSVVTSIVFIIVVDLIFTALFYFL